MTHNNTVNNLFFNQSITTVSTDYTALPDDLMICVSNTSAPRQITLPAPSPDNQGKFFVIKDVSGGASTTHAITVKSAAGWIDGVATKTIASNYGALEVYSDGVQYVADTGPSLSPTGTFARGGWVKFAKDWFNLTPLPMQAIINTSEKIIDSSARLNLSQLREVSPPLALQATDTTIKFTQAGLYQITFQAMVENLTNPVVQLIKNDNIILFAFATTSDTTDKRKLDFFHIDYMHIDDYIDFRLGICFTHDRSYNFVFYSVACFVQQLATEAVF